MRTADIIVVGAGPIGCFLARELSRHGYEVLVVEEHPEIGKPVHCTGIISAAAFGRFGLDRAAMVGDLGRIRFVSASGLSFAVSPVESKVVIVDREHFDQSLYRQAVGAGARVLLGTRVDQVTLDGQGVRVKARGPDGPAQMDAHLVVLATGVDQALLRPLGLARTPTSWLAGAQLSARPNGAAEDVQVHFGRSLAPGGFAWVVPVSSGVCRVGVLTTEAARRQLGKFADLLENRGLIGHRQAMVCRPMPCGARLPSFSDRVLAVGDAAGQVKTTTGGGVYFGLLGAEAACDAIHQAFRTGRADATALAGYERNWVSRMAEEQALGQDLRSYLRRLDDAGIDALFRFLMATGFTEAIGRLDFDRHCSGLAGMIARYASALGGKSA